ncbi:MAG: hypothetical protein J0H34_07655, partial [Rhizobiales bacterium]|nr:hypothetical protein [Hyphomicrobiales bacterium]
AIGAQLGLRDLLARALGTRGRGAERTGPVAGLATGGEEHKAGKEAERHKAIGAMNGQTEPHANLLSGFHLSGLPLYSNRPAKMRPTARRFAVTATAL